MQLDIRFPIGLLFTILGVVIGAYGLLTMGSQELYARSLGTNLNLWTGLGLLAFGLFMLIPAIKAQRAKSELQGKAGGGREEARHP
jgi:hypothetical protein